MLITTIHELMDYTPVSIDLDIRSISPSIRTAERRYLIPLIGQATYDELEADYSEQSLSDIQQRLLTYIGAVTGPLALWSYVQHGGVSIDNSGIYKARNENRWNLSDKEQDRLEDFYLTQGLDASEDLLRFLDTHADEFPTYTGSKEYQLERMSLVNSSEHLQEVFALLHPRSTFRALREALRYVELNRLVPAMLGFYKHLLETPEKDLSDTDLILRQMARRAAIYLAVQRAMITRTVKFTQAGIQVMMGDRTQVSEAENARIESAASQFGKSGEDQLQQLQKELVRLNPTGYTLPDQTPLPVRTKNPSDTKVLLI